MVVDRSRARIETRRERETQTERERAVATCLESVEIIMEFKECD
jgi:hypothetical protein